MIRLPKRFISSSRNVRRFKASLALVLALLLSLNTLAVANPGSTGERSSDSKKPGATPGFSIASPGLVTTDLTAQTPQDLVYALLGSGVTVSNVSFTGVTASAGTFTGGAGIIGFENGIILSSGSIQNVVGPNQFDSIAANNGLAGDPTLDALIPGYSTYDATVLEFDFVPTYDGVTFEYVFTSDEYNEYANTAFNDVFGFFLNGANVALLPGSNTAVSINNVNGGNPYGTNPQNPLYYINNDLDDGGGAIDTEMDGLTVVLSVQAQVYKNQVNHIKLAIADAGDYILDSNVFIRSSSFVSAPMCNGLVATIVGTAGNDVIMGTAGDDVIHGLGGNDTIDGLTGEDVICGGKGNDVLLGGDGNDMLFGEEGSDRLEGGEGDDYLDGGKGNDTLMGGPGNDTLVGGDGKDTANYSGATGPIMASLILGVAVGEGLDTLATIENLTGSPSNDALIGNSGPNDLRGLGGNDYLSGEGGNDKLYGGGGNYDMLYGGGGDDTMDGGTGTDDMCSGGPHVTGDTAINCESVLGVP